jgi:hypothetical protein
VILVRGKLFNNQIEKEEVMAKNLLEEIIEKLSENGKTLNNIIWVGFHEESSEGYGRTSAKMNLEKFIVLAKKVEYKKGCAQYQLLDNFVVVGEDWWLETHLNGYGERLVFKEVPPEPSHSRTSDKLPRFWCNI